MSKQLKYYGSTTSFSNLYYAAFGGTNEYAFRAGYSLNGLAAFSLGVWFRTSTAGNFLYIVSSPHTSALFEGVDIYIHTGGILRASVRTLGVSTLSTSPTTYNDNAWHYALLWYDGANAKLYVDNVEKATAARTGNTLTGANEFNLARFGTFGGYLTTDIDEVATWNSALDLTARTAAWNSGTPGNLINVSIPTPTAWWRWDNALDDMTGTTGTIRDYIGSNHLTPFNTEAADKVLY